MADNLTPAQRSYCMSQVKGRDTGLERTVMDALRRRQLRFRTYVADLPGRPDVVFRSDRIAVFIDGDFWHGYRFPAWRRTVSAFWREKIAKNRARDRRNFAKLRRAGWTVIRVWQHDVRKRLDECIVRIVAAVEARRAERSIVSRS